MKTAYDRLNEELIRLYHEVNLAKVDYVEELLDKAQDDTGLTRDGAYDWLQRNMMFTYDIKRENDKIYLVLSTDWK